MKNSKTNIAGRSFIAKVAVPLSVMAFGTMAHAAGEGTEAAAQITAAVATVSAIGAAVLAVYVAIKVFKFVRAAL